MNNDHPFPTHGDEAMEARIVACLHGEASAFEAAEVERLCNERPELMVFKDRIEALHDMLTAAENPQSDELWKLPPDKQKAVEDALGNAHTQAVGDLRETRVKHSGRRALLAIAACLVLLIVVAALATTWIGSRGAPNELALDRSDDKEILLETRARAAADMVSDGAVEKLRSQSDGMPLAMNMPSSQPESIQEMQSSSRGAIACATPDQEIDGAASLAANRAPQAAMGRAMEFAAEAENVRVAGDPAAPKDWQAWAEWAEKLHPVTDEQGHGPDIGSDEWASALGKRLGVIDADGHGPDPKSDEWRAAVESKLVPREKREFLSFHDTTAVFRGIREHKCMGLTSLCPDRCGHSGKLASFGILKYEQYEKPGEYGDPKQEEFQFLIEDNMGNRKVPDEIRTATLSLKEGEKVRLKWNHDYVTKNGASFPERTVVVLEKINTQESD